MNDTQPIETESPPVAPAEVPVEEGGMEEKPLEGNCPDEALTGLHAVCEQAEAKYRDVLTSIQTIRASEAVLQKFQARQGHYTPEDVSRAKQEFEQARQGYLEAGGTINEGIRQLYPLVRKYPQDLVLQTLYQTYLAKLLTSLEARNPVEPFVEMLAGAEFQFERAEVTLSQKETQRGLTVEKKSKNMLEEVAQQVNRLECRYQKRQLQTRLQQGEDIRRIIPKLVHLQRRDPDNLNTYIWLAKLKSELHKKERDQNKKVVLRDEVLDYCKKAFVMIDDFLTLQGLQSLPERDRRRSSYVKTITAIRMPLLS